MEQGHGRSELRRPRVIADPEVLSWLQERHAWPGLQAIGWDTAYLLQVLQGI